MGMRNLQKEEVERNQVNTRAKPSPTRIIILLGVGFVLGTVEDFKNEPVREFCRTQRGMRAEFIPSKQSTQVQQSKARVCWHEARKV